MSAAFLMLSACEVSKGSFKISSAYFFTSARSSVKVKTNFVSYRVRGGCYFHQRLIGVGMIQRHFIFIVIDEINKVTDRVIILL